MRPAAMAAGADPNASSTIALNFAIWNANEDNVRLLLKAGADANATTASGGLPLEIAMAAADTRALDGDFTLREMRVIQKAIIPLLLRFGSRIEKVERLALAGRASDSPEQLRQRKAICDELGRYLVSVRAAGSWAKWELQRHKPFVTMLEKCLPDNFPTEVTAVVVAFWVHACDYC